MVGVIKEVWRFVGGYDNKYSVSNLGNIRDNIKGVDVSKVIAGVRGNQYYYVNLRNASGDRKLLRVNRLVATAFVPNKEGKPISDHINRNKLDNRAINLRWATASENMRNTDNAVVLKSIGGEEVHLLDWLEESYPEEEVSAMYALSYRLIAEEGLFSIKDLKLHIEMHFCENKTEHRKVVEWDGKQKLLWDVCKELGREDRYSEILSRLYISGCAYSAIYNLPPIRGELLLLEGRGVGLAFSSISHLSESSGRSFKVCSMAVDGGWSYEELLAYRPPQPKLEIRGEWRTRREWINLFETSEQRVRANMTKFGLTFEEAVVLPVERVRRLLINGEETTVKGLWERYNLNAKYCNNLKSRGKLTFKEVLCSVGVDVTGMEVVPL